MMDDKIRIAVLSDTHGLLRPEVMEIVDTCSVVFHGGDINRQEILDQLSRNHFLYAVRGNNDKEWAERLAPTQRFELGGVHFFMVHNKKEVSRNLEGVDVVIFGHSHKYEERMVDGRLWLNPGSCGPRRFYQPITMAVLTVEKGSYQVEKIVIPQEEPNPESRDKSGK